jgi:F0F1-type ATP synthase assembly protein I
MESSQQETNAHTPRSDGVDYDVEKLPEQPQKRKLKTNKSYRDEWRYGSKARVVKYYAVHFCIGIVVGAIIGLIIGLCVRYVGKA